MGIAVTLSRLIYLNSYRHDLEFRIQIINQAKMGLLNYVNKLMNIGTDMDPDSPEVKQMEQRKQRLQLIDKQLDQELKEYQSKLEIVTADMQKTQQDMQRDIQMAYGGSK
jgi:molecular chaperone GrpE (heat shock protein)